MRILLVQTSFLGDTILSTPLIAALKQLHPDCELWMMTTAASNQLIRNDPLLSGTLIFDKRGDDSGLGGLWRMSKRLRGMRFDRVYSLHRSARTALLLYLSRIKERIGFEESALSFLFTRKSARSGFSHDVLRNLAVLSAEAPADVLPQELRLFLEEGFKLNANAAALLAKCPRYIVLVPGSAWYTKMWHWQRYREVAQRLSAAGDALVLLGSEQERAVAENVAQGLPVINLVGELALNESMAVIRGAQLVICNDSMALHLASAFKVPTVAIFCSTSPEFGFGPWRNKAVVLEKKGLRCKPCGRHGFRSCPLGTESCMRDLGADEVLAAVAGLVELRGATLP